MVALVKLAREYARLSPERQNLFSSASSVLTVRLLPCLFVKWGADDYKLCSIDITDTFLMVDLRELTLVAFEDAGGLVVLHTWQSVARTAQWISSVA